MCADERQSSPRWRSRLTPECSPQTFAIPLGASIVRRMPAHEDDGALMLRYAQGDLSAFTRLYERHKGQPLSLPAATDARPCSDRRPVPGSVEPRHREPRALSSRAQNFPPSCSRSRTTASSITADAQARLPPRAPNRIDDETRPALTDAAHRGPERQAESARNWRRGCVRRSNVCPPSSARCSCCTRKADSGSRRSVRSTGVGMETAKSRLRYALAKLRQSLGDVRDAVADVRHEGRAEARTVK